VDYREVLDSELAAFRVDLPRSQKEILVSYCNEVTRWNSKINLTALSGANLVRRLVVEPVWIGLQLKPHGTLLDIGSGNGSPAIPLRVVSQFTSSHLVEARTKRAAFLRHLASALQLKNIQVHQSRFEDVAETLKQPDWVTMQAVALTKELMDTIQRIATTTTTVVWITSATVKTALTPVRTLIIPVTGTKVLLLGPKSNGL
jgi:16S rRNA (guanine(527)-N(7))-methyltransferase RsmG